MIEPRPIPPFKKNPIEIKSLPEWINTESPLDTMDIRVSIFDRVNLWYDETIQYSKAAMFILKLAIAVINLLLVVQKYRKSGE